MRGRLLRALIPYDCTNFESREAELFSAAQCVSPSKSEAMKRVTKLTQKLGSWFSKESEKTESPLLLQSLEDRVLYSAVPLPVDNVDAPVENLDLDDFQIIEMESDTALPIGEAIAENTADQFLADDFTNSEFAAASPEATLEDLEQMINAIEEIDSVSTENDGPETAKGLVEVFPESPAVLFFQLQEGQSVKINREFFGNPELNFTFGLTLTDPPETGTILNNGQPVQQGDLIGAEQMQRGEVIYVPDPDFVGAVTFSVEDAAGFIPRDVELVYVGVEDDGVAVFGDTFAPIDGSAPTFEATAVESETQVESLSDGGYVVVSTLGASDGQVRFQMFDNDGIPTSGEISAAEVTNVENLDVTALDDGGFLVAYAGSSPAGERLNIQRFNSTGDEINFNGGPLYLEMGAFSGFDELSIEYLGEEHFVVAYIQSDTTEAQTIVFNLDGTLEKTFDSSTIQNGNNVSVATEILSDGGYVLARVEDDGGSNTIYASVFDPGGHLQEDVAIANGVTGNDVAVIGTTDNGFAILWQGSSTSPTGIYVARFDHSGNFIASQQITNASSASGASPDIVTLDDGSFVVSFTSVDSDGTQEVLGQRLNPDLSPLGDSFTINSFSAEDQFDAEIAVLNDGKLVSAFKSGDQSNPVSHFHQRLRMSVTGDEDTWIPLNSMVGIAPGSATEVFETLEITGLPIGSTVRVIDADSGAILRVDEIFFDDDVLTYNDLDIGQLEFLAPADKSGTFEATATVTTNDGNDSVGFFTDFQIVVNPVNDDARNSSNFTLTTNENSSLGLTQAEFIGDFTDVDGGQPNDLVNSISNVDFAETDFEDRVQSFPSPTSGIDSSYVFDGATPLTAELPAIVDSASFELWIRSEDFTGNDRVIAQFGDENQGFSLIQRQDTVVLQFKSDSSEIIELSADGLVGVQPTGSYDQIVVFFGTAQGDPNKLDAAIYLNGKLAESITDVRSAQIADVVQISDTLNLGSTGNTAGVGTSTADNFDGQLGLFRFENSVLDADEIRQRYDGTNNAIRIISINGQNLDSTDAINFTTAQNAIESTINVLPNGDLQFDPQSDFNHLENGAFETTALDVVVQRGLETFETVTDLNVVGLNDLPVQQFNEVTIRRDGGTQLIDLNNFVVDPDGSAGGSGNPPANMFLTTPVNGANIIQDANGYQIELVPFQLESLGNPVLSISVEDPNTGEISTYDLTVNLVDGLTISGVVAHDANLDGSIDGDTGFQGVNVFLYEADDEQFDLAAADFIAETQTDDLGRFVFDGSAIDFDKEYFVIVDSLTVALDAEDLGLVWAQQTFATQGAVLTGNNGLQLTQEAGYFIGGKDSEITDAFWNESNVGNAQHIISVSTTGDLTSINELGFGFNFDIVNVVDNSDQSFGAPPELDAQGTLGQFIHNANNIDGRNRMFFVPTTDENAFNTNGDQWWQIKVNQLLPAIRDDYTIIDGTALETSDNGLQRINTSSIAIPGGFDGERVGVAGDRIGEADAYLSTTAAPDLEITKQQVDDAGDDLPDLEYGIRIRGDADNLDVEGVTIENIAINGFGSKVASSLGPGRNTGNVIIDGRDTVDDVYNVSNFTLANNVIGTDPYFTSVPEDHNPANNVVVLSSEGSEIVTDSSTGSTQYSNVIENNVIGYADGGGIFLTSGGNESRDSDATSHWLIRSNQISFNGQQRTGSGDGIRINQNSNDVQIEENYINGNHAYGIDSFQSNGDNEILRNTIENNGAPNNGTITEGGGVRLFGIGNTVYANSISDNAGAGVHVAGRFFNVTSTNFASFHNQILSNEFSGNDGISIDLSRPLNEGGDPQNAADHDVSVLRLGDGVDDVDDAFDGDRGNVGIDAPIITSATYDGTNLTVTLDKQLKTDFADGDRVQIYLTENGVTHGEGLVLLGEVLATDLVDTGESFLAEISPPSDRLPLDLTQEININATLTAFGAVTLNSEGETATLPGHQTSEFSSSETLVVSTDSEIPTVVVSELVPEGQTAITTLLAPDLNNANAFEIIPGQDGASFSVDNSGALSFNSPQDHEAPTDIGGNNEYEVTVRATDDNGDSQDILVTVLVTDVDESPTFSATDPFDVLEGDTGVGQVTAADPEGQPISYSIKPDAGDGDLFEINAAGNISFRLPPDFENPNSIDQSNTYTLTVVADDAGPGPVSEQQVTVNVLNQNEAPVITPTTLPPINEGETTVTRIFATDAELDDITFALPSGVADSDLFRINAQTGELSFIDAPDFEAPQDTDANNRYVVSIIATDENGASTQGTVIVPVQNVNELPVFTNPPPFNIVEGNTSVGQVTATDPENDPIVFSIAQGVGDGDLFEIDAAGNVSFRLPPDFESPMSTLGTNQYTLTVVADDGNNGVTQQLVTVDVLNQNEVPVITPATIPPINEGETAVTQIGATDGDGDNITFDLADGVADSDLFRINAQTGELSFIDAPDFEAPQDTDANNRYVVSIIATDENGASTQGTVIVPVQNVNELPVFTNPPPFNIVEGNTSVGQVTATDPENDPIVFSIAQGVGDGDLFEIDAAGNVNFLLPPDFENPNSASNSNQYVLTVVADDGGGEVVETPIVVNVTNQNEIPTIGPTDGFNVIEGETEVAVITTSDLDGDTVVLSIESGVGDGDLFQIAPDGTLSFDSPPDFENPLTADGGNTYTLLISANDQNGGVTDRLVSVDVLNANVAPVIIADRGSFVDEGEDFVQRISATDADGDAVALSISDDGTPPVFTIDELGNITFINTPDFEMPFDADGNNVDVLTVLADDGNGGTSTQTITVTLNDINEAPLFVGDNQQLSLEQDESSTETFALMALFADPENQDMTLEIAGGLHANLFHIVNNELTLIDVPELIGPQSPTYEVEIFANDGLNDSLPQTVDLKINNINDRPEISDIAPVVDSLDEFQLSQVTPGALVADLNQAITFDRDGDPLSFELDGAGTDNDLFFVDGNNQLRFVSALQSPLEGVEEKNFDISVFASDGRLNSNPQSLSITVQNDRGVNVIDDETETELENNNNRNNQPQTQEPLTNDSNGGDPADASRPNVISTATPVSNQETASQPVTQRRNEINGITAVADSKIGDDDVFFDLGADSVSYDYQYGARGPQLVTQEIGDIMESRHSAEDTKLEESMLENYFWQGFEDSEDEFIRKNLEVDTTTIVAASAGLSLGLVSYLRIAAMATTVVTQLPAWKTLDVAPLITAFDEDEAETIHQIVDA